jgi:cytochrome bd ubiquinol oxidase subunit II
MDLQIIWFFLWALLWAVFFMTDGFDFGIGALLPILGKTDNDKRLMINAMGPFWDGNQVWLIAAGGVTFAAFPLLYATMFSALYAALMLILFALILRGVAMEFRGKSEDKTWRRFWDLCIFGGSVAPAVLFGVAFANFFQGLPIDGEGIHHGGLFSLLNGYGLLGGVLFLVLFIQHGALWLTIRTEGELQKRAEALAGGFFWAALATTLIFLIFTRFETRLFENFHAKPILFLLPLVTLAAFAQVKIFLMKRRFFVAWFSSALVIVSCVFFGFVGLFPTLLPSSIDPAFSLTAFNASSSPLTLSIMLGVVLVFVPIILIYQTWAYTLFRGKVTAEDLALEDAY